MRHGRTREEFLQFKIAAAEGGIIERRAPRAGGQKGEGGKAENCGEGADHR